MLKSLRRRLKPNTNMEHVILDLKTKTVGHDHFTRIWSRSIQTHRIREFGEVHEKVVTKLSH